MEPDDHSNLPDDPGHQSESPDTLNCEPRPLPDGTVPAISTPADPSFIEQVFIGDKGLRAGWSIVLFVFLFILVAGIAGFVVSALHVRAGAGVGTVRSNFIGELAGFIGVLCAAWIVALVERHGILSFNLAGPGKASNFVSGVVAGFLALSFLVGVLWAGGWLHFGPVALSGIALAKYAALWAITFVLVGCVEEGMFRCYLQYTLTRSINFWWAIGILGCACIFLAVRAKGTAPWGVYAMVLLGVVPCLLLQLKRAPDSNFWQAAWVTSTLFGMVHVSNNGENWIGIFAAAVIGFVFCVSIWLTGSAWWAIGCHAGWDWGETYFYGTADSGMVAHGHFLSTSPFGNAFLSGGTDGPEGSILVLVAILLLLVVLLVLYRRKPVECSVAMQAGDEIAG